MELKVAHSETPPFLSIVTVAYNNLEGLKRTCASVSRLKFDDFEHIVIDGGSSDATVAYLQVLKSVKWISEQDKGIYDAMNKGLGMASGRCIIFMNSGDEFFGPDSLSFLNAMKVEGAEKVVFGSAVFFEGASEFSFAPSVSSIYSFLRQNPFSHQAIVYPTLALRDAGGYAIDLKVSADFDITLRLFKACGGVVVKSVIARCELGGLSCKRRIQSLSDRLETFKREGGGGIVMCMYMAYLFYCVKLHVVDIFEDLGIMWPYRNIRSKLTKYMS